MLLALITTACAQDRLSTADTCIEMSKFNSSTINIAALPSSEVAEQMKQLSERSSEVLASELKLVGEVGMETAEQQNTRFLIDAEYEALLQAIATLNRACQ